jgi:hypothetical protein
MRRFDTPRAPHLFGVCTNDVPKQSPCLATISPDQAIAGKNRMAKGIGGQASIDYSVSSFC